jgi:outer membrane protein OmpA-like peptidoglycan-associated protein
MRLQAYLLLLLTLGSAAAFAQEDEPGCKDSALLARVPGCKILQCATKAEDSVDLTIGATAEGLPKSVQVDGASEVIYYLCSAKEATVEVVPTLEAALVKDAYQVAYSGKDVEESVVSARKLDQWIEISTYIYQGKPAYVQTALKTTPEEFVSAEDFEDQFPASLRVILPAVKFAAGKTTIAPAGEKVLAAVAALLAKKLDWKLRVDAYATEAADPASNLALSKARATAIVDWFGAHGVEKTRLDSLGLGDTVTIEGKQRIDLVKM